ncbi:hypothetical protein EV126DRAFT_324664, partial [Verticillium dahliae]
IGSLLYLALYNRLDITYLVNRYSKYISNPFKEYFITLNRIKAYLNKYPDIGLIY